MSATLTRQRPGVPRVVLRLAAAALVLGAVAALVALVGLVAEGAPVSGVARNPFGTGLREAAPGAGGIGGRLLAVQAEFHRGLIALLAAARRGDGAVPSLLGVGFLYGIFHAAGPGHGKGVIASYIVATRRTLARGLGLSTAAACLQAAVAIALVGVLALLFRAGSAAINAASGWIELASFAGLLGLGLVLVWRRSAAVIPPEDVPGHSHRDGSPCAPGCGHLHGVTAADAARVTTWRESAAVILTAGLRPCSGAIILLVFGLSQGVFGIAVAAVGAMAAGTAITTGALAALAVLAKATALRLAARRGEGGRRAVAWMELTAAAFVAILGGALLAGLSSGGLAG